MLLKIDYKALLYKMKKLGLDDEATPAADDSQDNERTFRSRQTD